jgi:hypothetical protein
VARRRREIMMSKETKTDDAGNKGFGLRGKVVDHKPGFDKGGQERKKETGGNHGFRRSEQKDIPQGSLAERIGKSKKGR